MPPKRGSFRAATGMEAKQDIRQDGSQDMRQDARQQERSIGELFGDLTRDMSTLIRQETQLATTEMTQEK